MSFEGIVVFVTASSEKEAQKISDKLIKKKLVACVNIVPGIQSIFRWKRKIYQEEELILMMKSSLSKFDEIVTEVKHYHSYDVPEIIALPIVAGAEDYLQWVEESIT